MWIFEFNGSLKTQPTKSSIYSVERQHMYLEEREKSTRVSLS